MVPTNTGRCLGWWWCAAWVLRRHGPPVRGASPLSATHHSKVNHFHSEITPPPLPDASTTWSTTWAPQVPARRRRRRAGRPARPGSTATGRATAGQLAGGPRRGRRASTTSVDQRVRVPAATAPRTGSGRRPGSGAGPGRRPWPRRRAPPPGRGRRSTPCPPTAPARRAPSCTSAPCPGPSAAAQASPSHRNDRPTSSLPQGVARREVDVDPQRVVGRHQDRAPTGPAAHDREAAAAPPRRRRRPACCPAPRPGTVGTSTSTRRAIDVGQGPAVQVGGVAGQAADRPRPAQAAST